MAFVHFGKRGRLCALGFRSYDKGFARMILGVKIEAIYQG